MLSGKELKARLGAMRFYLIMLFLISLAGYLGYKWGNYHGADQAWRISAIEESLANATEENNKLIRSINILGVELEVERLANQKLQGDLQQSLQRQAEVRKELSFYQKVMAPSEEELGVVLDSLDIEATTQPGTFRYVLVLMQKNKRKEVVEGKARVILHGQLNGQPHKLDLVAHNQPKTIKQEFRFKYFEVLDGNFSLPAGFVPERIEVDCELERPKRDDINQSFEWALSIPESAQGQ
ncbi:hypothetical protein P2G88_09710 [Aliiglaciecola sp. CAU 1673]|uniref:DUF6776 family protein n=1 Tax=Aliiglaciecola sp. CAU 1673 TaxID=3032595 RepID=UPI0023DB853C|nr:DUF6776 family protein [Aliiglaciecola sp. CAU 1673]MDF2178529.1 hypothetical protein [Aliiglaciecola sp. CAU 1673]